MPLVHGAPERNPNVVVLTLEAVQPACLVGAQEMALARLGKVPEVTQVAIADLIGAAGSFELIAPVLADRFQHAEARLDVVSRPAKEALIHQGCDPVYCLQAEFAAQVADHFSCFECAAPGEGGEASEER